MADSFERHTSDVDCSGVSARENSTEASEGSITLAQRPQVCPELSCLYRKGGRARSYRMSPTRSKWHQVTESTTYGRLAVRRTYSVTADCPEEKSVTLAARTSNATDCSLCRAER